MVRSRVGIPVMLMLITLLVAGSIAYTQGSSVLWSAAGVMALVAWAARRRQER